MIDAKPRVAKFSTHFLPYSQTFVHDELRHHRRYDADVFCHRRMNPELFPWPNVHAMEPAEGLRGRAASLIYKVTTFSAEYLRRLRSGRYALLHAHFGPGSIYALPYHAALDLPLVVTVHGYDVPVLLTRERFRPVYWRYWAFSPWLLRSVDRFLAASSELAELLGRLGVPEDRIRVWRLGVVLPTRTEPPAAGPVMRALMVGRFVEKKGFEYGIEGFARVAAGRDDVRLDIVGDGDRRAEYERIIAEHGLGDRVRFLGVLPHEQVLAQMAEHDLLIAPSVVARDGNRESGLIVVKEAAARSIPTIGTHHGGIPEIIDDGSTGFLVPERDPEAIATRLRQLVDDPARRRAMGEAARDKMEREYDIVRRVDALEDHYDEILARRRR